MTQTPKAERGQTRPGETATNLVEGTASKEGVRSESSLLEVEDLTVEFRGTRSMVRAVRGISYNVERGEILGIVGESGSGKSVSALALMGLLPRLESTVVSGRVRLIDRELIGLSERGFRSIRSTEMSMVFQDPLSSLNPRMTVGKQIEEVLRVHRGLGRSMSRARAIELLQLVEIPSADRRIDSYPHQFSGGMRQRAMLAMAIACEPSILIADEPTTALDVTVQAQILDLIRELRDRLSMSVVLITHDLGVVAGITDRVAVMYAGRFVEVNDTRDLLAKPQHPYTDALIRSVPALHGHRSDSLYHIEGTPPDPTTEIRGCSFTPRCPFAIERCHTDDPRLEHERGGLVACWVKPELEARGVDD